MERFPEALKTCLLFEGIRPEDIGRFLSCAGAVTRRYGKGETVLEAGACCDRVGIVLEGTVDAVALSSDGRELLVARKTASGVFADLLAAAGRPSPVTLTAPAGAAVLYLPLDRIMDSCSSHCGFHTRIRKNLLRETASKYWELKARTDILSAPNLREKILILLSQHLQEDGTAFLPYSREDMARVLNADRSALSRELGRMKRDGLLEFRKNCFRLTGPSADGRS